MVEIKISKLDEEKNNEEASENIREFLRSIADITEELFKNNEDTKTD